jgi:hypothetical protein
MNTLRSGVGCGAERVALDEQQTEHHFSGSGMPPVDEGLRVARGEIGADAGIEQIVVEQPVKLPQDRIGLTGEFRDTGEDVFIGMAIDQHRDLAGA